jgi:hypothetical protein
MAPVPCKNNGKDIRWASSYTFLLELFHINAGKRVPFHAKFNENNMFFPITLRKKLP